MSYVIRDAVTADLPAIRDIYNDAVLNTLAIWNEQTVDLPNREQWFKARQQQGYPVLVIVDDANVPLGYASFGDWRPFEGFRHTVERARGCGKHVMVAAIESANAASIHVHKQLGFVTSGRLPQVGIKFGRWLDLTFMQLMINPGALPPQEHGQ